MAGHEIDLEWCWPIQNGPTDFYRSIIASWRHRGEVLCFCPHRTKSKNLSPVCQSKLIVFRRPNARSWAVPVVKTQLKIVNVKNAASPVALICDRINSCRGHFNRHQAIEEKRNLASAKKPARQYGNDKCDQNSKRDQDFAHP